MSHSEEGKYPTVIEIEDLESNQHLLEDNHVDPLNNSEAPPLTMIEEISFCSEEDSNGSHSRHITLDVIESTPKLPSIMSKKRNSIKLPELPKLAVSKKLRPGVRRHERRLVFKNGEVNIVQMNVQRKSLRFLIDIFTTVIDMKWRYTFVLFLCAFIMSWVGFAVLWWIMSYAHDDLKPENLVNSDYKMCVANLLDFQTALLFSIETQHTIGYGARMVTSTCPEGSILLMIQSVFGVVIQVFMTGIIFAKLSRPKKRTRTLMFSSNAAICLRDGKRILMVRVGDMRKSHFVCSTIRGILLKKRITEEGEVIPLEQWSVSFGTHDGDNQDLFLVWPVLVCHKINEDSPFWEMAAKDFVENHFELVIILEGVAESTGMTTQARCSYLPHEILWGYRFQPLVTYQKERGGFQMDFTNFNNMSQITDFSSLNAKDYQQLNYEDYLSSNGDENQIQQQSDIELLDSN